MQRSRSLCSRRPISFLFSSVLLSILTACSGGGSGFTTTTTPPPSTPTLSTVAVTPGTPSVAAGLAQQFKATGTWSDGSTKDITSTATWTSGTTSVAIINASGVATSKAEGTAVITATSGSVSGSATLTVSPAVLASISVAPTSVQIGATTQLKATGTWTDQSTQDLTNTVSWTLANNYVANTSASGLVTSLHAGYSTVTATDGSIQGSGALAVLASPRYLYVSGDAGSTITRMAVDSNSGQPRFLGDLQNLNRAFACLTVDPSGTHAYQATTVTSTSGSGYSGIIDVYLIDPVTGALSTVPGSPFTIPFAPACLVFAPSGNFAYALTGTFQAGTELAQFAVNRDASLTLVKTISYTDMPISLAVDPLGQYLYVATLHLPGYTTDPASLYGYSIDSTTGALSPLDGSPWPLAPGTDAQLAFHPSGDSLFVANLNAMGVVEFTINRGTGVPTQSGTADSPCSVTVRLQFSPDATHAYGICGAGGPTSAPNNTVVSFSVAANGQMTLQNTAFGGPVPREILVDPSGNFLYVLGSGHDYIADGNNGTYIADNVLMVYQVQSDGSVKLVNQIAGRDQQYSMALVSGAAPVTWQTTNAYTTTGDNKLTPYTVASDGRLTPGASVTTPAGPFSASTLPWGSDLLLATQTAAPNLYTYALSGTTLSAGLPLGSTSAMSGVVIGPAGDWAFATDPIAGTVDLFDRAYTGQWYQTFTGGGAPYSFPADTGAGPITIDPSGRYVFVASPTSKTISLISTLGFSTGAGTPPPKISLSFSPLTVTADPTGNLFFVAGDDSKLHMFSSNGLGWLTEAADGTLLGNNTASVTVDPIGHFVYAAGPAGLNAFSIDTAAGTLTPIALNLGVSLQNATCISVDPTGKDLYVAVSSGTTNALYLFTVNSDGTLTASSATPVATPNQATSIVFQATVQ